MCTTRLEELDGVRYAAVADGPVRTTSQGEADAGVDVEAFALGASASGAGKAGDSCCHRGGGRDEGDDGELELHGESLFAG